MKITIAYTLFALPVSLVIVPPDPSLWLYASLTGMCATFIGMRTVFKVPFMSKQRNACRWVIGFFVLFVVEIVIYKLWGIS